MNNAAALLAPIYALAESADAGEADPRVIGDALERLRLTPEGKAAVAALSPVEAWLYDLGRQRLAQHAQNLLDQQAADKLAALHGGRPSDYLPLSHE